MRARMGRHLAGLLGGVAPGAAGFAPGVAREAELQLPPEFTWPDFTVFLLSIAAQIEHSLMVQYLYAAYSLGGPQVPPEHRDAVAAWRQIILGIAKEEMGHLVTVQNALTLLGAPLELDREDYPWDSGLAPYPFVLEPLTRKSLAKYIVAESPEVWPADVADKRREIEDLAAEDGGSQINRVGVLYDHLIKIIDDPQRTPNRLFHPETFPLQASWDEWGRGYGKGARGSSLAGTTATPDVLVLPMASRADAIAALRAVAEQGEAVQEATAENPETSHFRRFLDVYCAFPADGTWEPALRLPCNPAAPGVPVGKDQTLIEDRESGVWANIFNLRYRMLLTYLGHSYHAANPPGATAPAGRRGFIINRLFGEMYNLRAIASILVRLPLEDGSALRCGPPFQMPYSLQLPGSEAAYWGLHLELMAATDALLKQAGGFGHPERSDFAAALAGLDAAAVEEMSLYAAADSVRTGAHRMIGTVR